MSFQLKLTLIVAGIIALLLVPYFLWHEAMDAWFCSQECRQWLLSIKPYAWAIGIGLLVGDLFLPIPAPPVMATLGVIYGPVLGGVISAAGSFLAGLTAYGLARLAGRRAARFLASERDLANLQRLFDTWGGGAIIATRALPILPEVLTFLAGLAPMHLGRFCVALALGSLPVGMLLAWAGNAAGATSGSLLLLTLIPVAIWSVYMFWAAWRRGVAAAAPESAAEAERSDS